MIWRAKRLWHAATGPTGRSADERETLDRGYFAQLTGLLILRKIGLWTWVWALRARPASICGRGGAYALADWLP